jgi:HK97 family phage prohead protease
MKLEYDAETARDLKQVMRTFSGVKQLAAQIKRSPTDGSGRFTAIVSTYGPPPDTQMEIVSPGAFRETIADASVRHPGSLWPIYWMHDYKDPSSAIGVITAAAETSRGLAVEGRLAIESSDKAMAVYEGMLEDTIREWSIGFGVVDAHMGLWTDPETGDACEVRYLNVLELLEISSVMAGANRFTETLAVKSNNIGSNTTATWKGVARGTVFLDESAFKLPEGYENLPGHQRWHIEQRGDSYCVVFEGDGTVVSEHATVEGARVRLTDLYTEAIAANELKSINARLDEIEKGRPRYTEDVVDEFIREDRAQRERKRAERERQVAWEERMRINMVLDPVPIRVDARMRPVAN